MPVCAPAGVNAGITSGYPLAKHLSEYPSGLLTNRNTILGI